jgi:hypothetical protein
MKSMEGGQPMDTLIALLVDLLGGTVSANTTTGTIKVGSGGTT